MSAYVHVRIHGTLFLPKDHNTELIKESDFDSDSHRMLAPDWLEMLVMIVTASCLSEWWSSAAQWEGSGEDATVIQEKTAHCSWEVGEV